MFTVLSSLLRVCTVVPCLDIVLATSFSTITFVFARHDLRLRFRRRGYPYYMVT
jgi:hypothetical protein